MSTSTKKKPASAVKPTGPRFEIFITQSYHGDAFEKRAGYRWRFIAGNGENVAYGEEYTRKANALKAIRAIQRAASAPVLDLSKGAKA